MHDDNLFENLRAEFGDDFAEMLLGIAQRGDLYENPFQEREIRRSQRADKHSGWTTDDDTDDGMDDDALCRLGVINCGDD